MESPSQIVKRFREVVLNGTWVAGTNFRDQLTNVSAEQATQKIGSLNTIALLTSHIHYYISGILNVLEGGTLDIRDKFSFDFPAVKSQEDWEKVLNKFWNDSEKFANLVEQMTKEKLNEDFTDRMYGSYQRNINAMIEHCYYHLGQIVLIKKLILNKQ